MAPRPDVDVDTVEECVASTSEGHLRVMPSLIPGAGLGLFTGEDVPAGTVVDTGRAVSLPFIFFWCRFPNVPHK